MNKKREGEFWADKLMDLANLEAVVLIFSQFTTPRIYWGAVAVGAFVYLVIILVARKLRGR